MRPARLLLLLLLPWGAATAVADQPRVVSAEVRCDAQRVCHFEVTVSHADEGWNHYADRWELRTPGGRILGARVLRHPHLEEQPFERSLDGVRVPREIDRVVVRVRDSQHGWGEDYSLALPR